MAGKTRLEHLPIDSIRPGDIALRGVDQDSQQFRELADSILDRGILNAISVREKLDEATKQPYYELIDGLQRFTAAKAVGLSEVPAQILDQDDEQVMFAQIIGNAKRVEMKPVDYMNHILKILTARPTMTEAELAEALHASPQWIGQILKLKGLHADIKPLVNEGHIPLANAFALAKLPEEIQLEYLNEAQTKTSQEFSGPILERVKQIKAANRQGKEAGEAQFVPIPRLRKLNEVEEVLNDANKAAPVVQQYAATVADSGIQDVQSALAGFLLGVRWAARVDPDSIEKSRAEFEAKKKSDAEAKTRRDAERADKRQKEAEERAEKARKAAEAAKAKAAQLPPAPVEEGVPT